MPKVNGKHYSYTEKGKKAAKKAKMMMSGKKMMGKAVKKMFK